MVGGSAAGQRNVISGNDTFGIGLGGGGSQNTIRGNYIGVGSDGSTAIPQGAGVSPQGSFDNDIGGLGPGEGNVISGNSGIGVFLDDPTTDQNSITGNLIGTDATGTLAVGNAHHRGAHQRGRQQQRRREHDRQQRQQRCDARGRPGQLREHQQDPGQRGARDQPQEQHDTGAKRRRGRRLGSQRPAELPDHPQHRDQRRDRHGHGNAEQHALFPFLHRGLQERDVRSIRIRGRRSVHRPGHRGEHQRRG